MKIDETMREQAVLRELAVRIKQYRIAMSLTQDELAERSMISLGTVRRFERGEDISFLNVIRLLSALNLLHNLDLLVVDPENRPSFHLEKEKKRERASKRSTTKKEWKWGEDR